LVKGLYRALIDEKDENDLQNRDAHLVELHQLQQAWPQDAAVRELLAKRSKRGQSTYLDKSAWRRE
jgi:hypothetical protein